MQYLASMLLILVESLHTYKTGLMYTYFGIGTRYLRLTSSLLILLSTYFLYRSKQTESIRVTQLPSIIALVIFTIFKCISALFGVLTPYRGLFYQVFASMTLLSVVLMKVYGQLDFSHFPELSGKHGVGVK